MVLDATQSAGGVPISIRDIDPEAAWSLRLGRLRFRKARLSGCSRHRRSVDSPPTSLRARTSATEEAEMSDAHAVVSREEWLAARKELLAREKELTRLRDELSAQRRSLPWERVEKRYEFQTNAGTKSLAELFGDKHQLAVYHFMFAPDWQVGCKSCSFWADNFNGITPHLEQRDISFFAISRAPLPKLQEFAKRMGWSFPWASSSETDFNFDYQVSYRPEQQASKGIHNYVPIEKPFVELPGISVFYRRDDGAVFHTYSTYGRGIEVVNGAYYWLDLVPKGRDEASLEDTMDWVKLHDEYAR
jgi:predicted dithiol-disulfide oxidoreductase (DUF899 family)